MIISRYFLLFLLLSFLSLEADPLLIGYYSNKAQYRPGAGSCMPHHLSPILSKIDILHYGFLLVNAQGAIKPAGPTYDSQIHFSEWNDGLFLKELREKNPSLKIVVTIHNPHILEGDKQKAFIDSLGEFCQQNEIQGIDIKCEKEIPLQLLKNIRSAVSEDFILALSLTSPSVSEAKAASSFVSFFVISCQQTLKTLLEAGLSAEKIVLGISPYAAAPLGYQGYYTREPGRLSYFEVIDSLERGLLKEKDLSYTGPQEAYNKSLWAAEKHLKGVALDSLDADNFMDPISPFALTEALSEGLKP